jgi:hypothetical protein
VSKVGPSNPFQFSLAWLLAYITVMAFVCGGMAYGRWQAFRIYGTDEARMDWAWWRMGVAVEQNLEPDVSVERKVPQSKEPPALVLMRDHFAVCLVGALLLSSVLFATFMVFIRGALTSSAAPIPDSRPDSPTR